MLKGIHPLLSADLLHALQAMGHGDEIAIVDANFPAARLARRLVDMPGVAARDLLAAVLTVLPLDADASPAAFTMEVIGDPAAVPLPVAEFRALLAPAPVGALARHAFYDRAGRAFVIARTGEPRPYGNVLLVKGVVDEGAR